MTRPLRVATRGSALALEQAARVIARLGVLAEPLVVSTRGDRDQHVPIHAVGGTGVFVKEIQEAVLAGRAELAVHSAKDLPAHATDGLVIGAFPERGDPRDALVGSRLVELRTGARVATGSVRRRAQLAAARPDLTFAELRGNIGTRVARAHAFDAIVVAVAALDRLGLRDRATDVLDPEVMLPQVGQGALAVDCRDDDGETRALLAAIDDPAVRVGVEAERAYLAELGGGCDLPVGALGCQLPDGTVALTAVLASLDGRVVVRATAAGPDPATVGREVARRLVDDDGGRMLLDDLGDQRVTVYLVGAGPGDPGLLTVRGAALLARADVVVYDRLAAPALLELAPVGAERVDVGKAPGRVAMDQEAINAVLVERGRRGLVVVRLKGGDPFVFGRGGEEAEALGAAKVPFEVVPGITSAIAAPAYAGIPVTHRGLSTHVTVVTGHEDPAKGRADVEWEALARAGGTLVILMGAGRIAEIARRLVAGGRASDTPVAAVRNGTRPDQQTVRTTLGALAEGTSPAIEAPSAVVVGAVAVLELDWFARRPLFGRRIVVTRAREQASELRAQLEALGAEVVELPTIAIEPVEFALPELDRYGWLVLTSANGVEQLFERGLSPLGLDARSLARLRIAAIGPGTAAALAARGVRADLVPDRFVAESLLDAFPAPAARGERVLLARAEVARDVLPDGLGRLGFGVDVLTLYRTSPARPDVAALERVRRGDVDAVTFTSSSTVHNFCDLVGPLPAGPSIVSIGPITSQTARERGLTVTIEAEPHTVDAVVDALLAAFTPDPPR